MKAIYVYATGRTASKSKFGYEDNGMIVQLTDSQYMQLPKVVSTTTKGIKLMSLQQLKDKLKIQFEAAAEQELNKNNNITSIKKSMDYAKDLKLNPSIVETRTQNGQLESQRIENAEGITGADIIEISIDTTDVVGTETYVLGDGLGTIADYLQLEPTTGVIGGTWGEKTLSQIKSRALAVPFVVKGGQMQTNESTGSIFTGTKFKVYKTTIQNNPTFKPLDLITMQNGTQFNQFQRGVPGLKIMFTPENALVIQVPGGQILTLTLIVESVTAAWVQAKF